MIKKDSDKTEKITRIIEIIFALVIVTVAFILPLIGGLLLP